MRATVRWCRRGLAAAIGACIAMSGLAACTDERLEITPSSAATTPGAVQEFNVRLVGADPASGKDVTSDAVFTISPDGSCEANRCAATATGAHRVSVRWRKLTASATLTVTDGEDATGTSSELIADAVRKGEISTETGLLYDAYAAVGDSRLPTQYLGEVDQEALALLRLRRAYPTLSPEGQALAAPFLMPAFYQGSWYDLSTAAGASEREPSLPDESPIVGGGFPCTPTSIFPAVLHAGWRSLTVEAQGVSFRIWWDDRNRPFDRQDAELAVREIPTIMRALTAPSPDGVGMRPPRPDAGGQPWTCEGPDEAVDVELVALPANELGVVTAMHDETEAGVPSRITVSTSLSPDEFKATLAHEFMHACQNSYAHSLRQDRLWLAESTAIWAQDATYPEMNSEHAAAEPSFDPRFERPLDSDRGTDPYSAYLFFLFLAGEYRENQGVVSAIWQRTENMEVLPAVDDAIAASGGLAAQWRSFAVESWNEPGLDLLKHWDLVPRGPARLIQPETLGLSGDARTDTNARNLVPRPMDPLIQPLSARYARFHLTDYVRGVFVSTEYPVPEGLTVTLLVNSPSEGWKVAGIMEGKKSAVQFCRDDRPGTNEDIDEVALVVANSTFGATAPSFLLEQVEVRAHRACRWPALTGQFITTSGNPDTGNFQVLTVDVAARETSWFGSVWTDEGTPNTEARDYILDATSATVAYTHTVREDDGTITCHYQGTAAVYAGYARMRVEWLTPEKLRVEDPVGNFGESVYLPSPCSENSHSNTRWGATQAYGIAHEQVIEGQVNHVLSGSFDGSFTLDEYSSSWRLNVVP